MAIRCCEHMGAGEDLTVCVTSWDTATQKVLPMVTAPVAASGVLYVSTSRSVWKGWSFLSKVQRHVSLFTLTSSFNISSDQQKRGGNWRAGSTPQQP